VSAVTNEQLEQLAWHESSYGLGIQYQRNKLGEFYRVLSPWTSEYIYLNIEPGTYAEQEQQIFAWLAENGLFLDG
jgi:hypothetical protein